MKREALNQLAMALNAECGSGFIEKALQRLPAILMIAEMKREIENAEEAEKQAAAEEAEKQAAAEKVDEENSDGNIHDQV